MPSRRNLFAITFSLFFCVSCASDEKPNPQRSGVKPSVNAPNDPNDPTSLGKFVTQGRQNITISVPILAKLAVMNPLASPKVSPKHSQTAALSALQTDGNDSYFLTAVALPNHPDDLLTTDETSLESLMFITSEGRVERLIITLSAFIAGKINADVDTGEETLFVLTLHEIKNQEETLVLETIVQTSLLKTNHNVLLTAATGVAKQLISRQKIPLVSNESYQSWQDIADDLKAFNEKLHSSFKATSETSLGRMAAFTHFYVESRLLQNISLQAAIDTTVTSTHAILKDRIVALDNTDEAVLTTRIGRPLTAVLTMMLKNHQEQKHHYIEEASLLLAPDALSEITAALDSEGAIASKALPIPITQAFRLGQGNSGADRVLYTGMVNPYSVFSDGTRIYVADSSNNRVLIWNHIPTINNQVADLVLGQPDLTSNRQDRVSARTLNSPHSISSDSTRLYVADSINNRVLIWNTIPTSNGQAADVVLGQSDMTSTSANAGGVSASSLHYPRDAFSDGTRLYIADAKNNRILIWNSIPTVNGHAADIVLGQTAMNANTEDFGGISASSLHFPTSVSVAGSQLFAADVGNHRVLSWSNVSTSGQAANFVLGQPSMTANTQNTGGISPSTLSNPTTLTSDGTRLFVADQSNSRVLLWKTLPTSTAQAANIAIGQPTVNSANNTGLSATTLRAPAASFYDGQHFFVADTMNRRLLIWNQLPSIHGIPADIVLGQPNMDSNEANAGGLSATNFSKPSTLHFDGTHLVVADTFNNRVLIWNQITSTDNQAADLVIGQPDMTTNHSNDGGTSANTLSHPEAAWTDGTHLFISDTTNNRILVWDTFPTSNKQNADRVLGQSSLTTHAANAGGVSGKTLSSPRHVFYRGEEFFVTDSDNHRVLIWNTLPLSNDQPADLVLGQQTMTTNAPNNGGVSASALANPSCVSYDGTHLLVVDKANNRVLIWNKMPTTNGQAADLVLGQPLMDSLENQKFRALSASTLGNPSSVFSDGIRVWVADSSNNRILIWDQFPKNNGQAADRVIGQNDFISNTTNGLSASSFNQPSSVYLHDGFLFITDQRNHRLIVQAD